MSKTRLKCAVLAAAMPDEELVNAMRRLPGQRPTALQKAVKTEAFRRNLEAGVTGFPDQVFRPA